MVAFTEDPVTITSEPAAVAVAVEVPEAFMKVMSRRVPEAAGSVRAIALVLVQTVRRVEIVAEVPETVVTSVGRRPTVNKELRGSVFAPFGWSEISYTCTRSPAAGEVRLRTTGASSRVGMVRKGKEPGPLV